MLISLRTSLFERQKPSKLNYFINIALFLLILILFAEILFNLRYTSILVDGRSMMPTLTGAQDGLGGDYIFIDKMISPTYGDIVVVEPEEDYVIIKRVVAFGGDSVKIEFGVLSIKYAGTDEFVTVEEDYLSPEFNSPELSKNKYTENTVPEGCMFLLGDNRNESADSRIYGFYKVDDILGVVPGWALEKKALITAFYTYFKSLIPHRRISN